MNTDLSKGKSHATKKTVLTIDFDSSKTLVRGEDYYPSGATDDENVGIFDAYDHTSGNGKCLGMVNRWAAYNRIKLKHIFSEDDRGKAFEISAWFLVPDTDASIRMATYGAGGSVYSFNPYEQANGHAKKGEWTRLTLIHKHIDDTVDEIGFEQSDNKPLAKELYIDDITVTDITGSVDMPKLDVQLKLDGKKMVFKGDTPEAFSARMFFPLEAVMRRLHCVVERRYESISVIKGDNNISLELGSKRAFVNGRECLLSAPLHLTRGCVMAPLDLISSALGLKAYYREKTLTAYVETTCKNEINIYRDCKKQELYGFGSSGCVPRDEFMLNTDAETQKKVLTSLYGNDGKSAAFSIIRMGISPNSAANNGSTSVTINPAKDVWDFGSYDYQRFGADEALKINPDIKFLASCWSPPAWMKENGDVTGNTQPNKLSKEHYDDYVNYLAVWTDTYKNKYGYDIRWLSVQNEPCLNTTYASCLYSPEELRVIVDKLGEKYMEMGIDTAIGGCEGAFVGESYGIMRSLVGSAAGFVPTHPYCDEGESSFELYDLSEFGLPVIQTEYNLSPKEKKKYIIEEALRVSRQISNCLNGGYNAYLYWYGGRLMGETDSPGNCESLIDYHGPVFLYAKEFFVMAQFSRAFRPGDRVATSYSEHENVRVASAVNEKTGLVSAILTNLSSEAVTLRINGLRGRLGVYITDRENEFERKDDVDAGELVSYTLPPQSITLLTEGQI